MCELISLLKGKLVSVYPGFTFIRVTTPAGKTERYGLAYTRSGLLVAGEIDLPVRFWSFYRDVEEFYSLVVGDGVCSFIEKTS